MALTAFGYNYGLTKVQIHLALQRPLDDEMMERISDANSIYGIEHVKILSSLKEIVVEYDATRLKPDEIERALALNGISAKTMAA